MRASRACRVTLGVVSQRGGPPVVTPPRFFFRTRGQVVPSCVSPAQMRAAESDEELLTACRAGSPVAFGKLVDRYRQLVCAVTYARTGDVALSEDLAQDAFVAAWHRLETLRDAGRFRAWLCTIARNLSRNARRDRAREIVTADPPEVASEPETDALERQGEEATVWRALATMPEHYREPLVLFYREGRSAAEIAAALGLSVSATEQRLSRGRRRLRQHVETTIERTLARSKPGAGFTAAVLAGLASQLSPITAHAASEATASLLHTTASTKATLVKLALHTTALLGVIATLAYGCAHWEDDGETTRESQRRRTPAEVDTTAGAPPRGNDQSTALEHRIARERSGGLDRVVGTTALPAYLLTRHDDRYVSVALGGGIDAGTVTDRAIHREALPSSTIRVISGRVLDDGGEPVAGAVVIAGTTLLSYDLETLSGQVGATTDELGRYRLPMPHGDATSVLAVHPRGWSPRRIVEAGVRPVRFDLDLGAPARIVGRLRLDDDAVQPRAILEGDPGFLMIVTGAEDGTFEIPQVPPGELDLRVAPWTPDRKLRLTSKRVHLAAGATERWDLDLVSGPMVVVDAKLPDELDGSFITVGLVPGDRTPRDPAAWDATLAEIPFAERHWMPVGVGGIDPIAQFDGVEPGTWTACAQAQPSPREPATGLGCAVVRVAPGSDVTELDVAVTRR
ncbi:MAG: sigma-70 family RNA polymerase sigma factor [Myxococcales bacterium]|nr:sigma-70 family RNA polymerase sigma factor [Myxococcales bacterium]